MTYSANDNQNFFVQSGRTTSRVVAQPGGGSSLCLGGWTPEELERQRQLREGAITVAPTQEEQEEATPVPMSAKENEEVVLPKETKEVSVTKPTQDKPAAAPLAPRPAGQSSNAFASSSSTNSYNVITDRPTSRVLAPPGGHSSIRLW
eukprot:Nitzschia sp. Nitz4//scaffold106_size73319//50097//50540//NITZ4_005741-RA/size73319-processed-gene-0.70-mRNA-1//-1//CDS//3329532535//6279//frame0